MKTSKLISISFAAGLAGVALAKIGSLSALASLPGANLFALGASLAVVGFAAYDYSRRHLPLRPKAPTLGRPALPASWQVAPQHATTGNRCPQAGERTAA